MRLASFNVENLFTRPAVMNLSRWQEGEKVLDDIDTLNALISKPVYSDADKEEIEEILNKYDFANRKKADRPFSIIEVRQKLYKVPVGSRRVEVVANGRDAWGGWVDLRRDELEYGATRNTARVIHEVDADVLATIEVENRITMHEFHDQVLKPEYHTTYEHLMCIDGNDPRGIDVGIMSRFPIASVRSHVDDKDGRETPIFRRDCCEYELALPNGAPLLVLANHFKSKGSGGKAADKTREREAAQVAKIYHEAEKRSDYIAVVGDLNDTPDSAPLAKLAETDLRDVSTHELWQGDVGTYGTGRAKNSKIDYILLSPELWKHVTGVGIERRGVYAPKMHVMWEDITKTTAASDHGALWVDLEI